MTPDDMAALHAACFITPPPWTVAAFRALLHDPGVLVLQAPAGFAIGRVVLDEAELLTLAVAHGARRQGVGRDLLALFDAQARRFGAETAFLEVSAENHPARALYAGCGYRQAGERPGYYTPLQGPRVAALILRKSLLAG